MLSIDPSDRGSRHAEMQMDGHGIGIARLCGGAADLLLDLSEAGFDVPTTRIMLDDLLDAERQIRSHQRSPLAFAVNPDHTNATTQCLERDDSIDGHDLA